MPVSTRSQILNNQDENGLIQDGTTLLLNEQHRQPHMAHAFRNPHHGLKEKLKSLTLMYEQQKLSSMAVKQQPPKPEEPQLSSIQPAHHLGSSKIEERRQYPPMAVPTPAAITTEATTATTEIGDSSLPDVTVRKTHVSAKDDAKENVATNGDRIIGFTCPRKASVTTNVSRKLSLGSQLETKGISTETQSKCALLRKQSINRRILVFVRLRPMMKKEKDAGARSCVRIVNRRDVFLTEFATEHDYLRLKRLRGRHFSFDASFPESATQQEVYSTTTAELVESVLEGRNGSVFCYGATGAGKTYTMLGTVESPGVMALAIKDLFNKIRQRSYDGNHAVHLSYLEVYNETVRDLLSPGRPLILREDKQTYVATTYMVGQIQGIVAAGLTQYRAYSTDEVMALLLQGNKNRTTEPTRVNETSSRSHAIFQVMVEYRTKDSSFSMNVVNRIGKLSLIDLAGSERALATDQRTIRSVEGANINRSLLALSSCINALVEGKKHIPYRNSKLTQLLKDSLGGSCNTVMIANISPSSLSFGETQNTLHWADRAKEIRNKASDITEQLVQVLGSPREQAKLLLQVQKENRELRAQLARQQQKLLTIQAQSLAAANSSPAPSTNLNPLLTPQSNSIKQTERRRPKSLAAAYHGGMCHTPDARKRGTLATVRELQQTVIVLESRIERMKIDHAVQLKKKDEKIQELSQMVTTKSSGKGGGGGEEGVKMIVTRASLRPKETNKGDLRISRNRFQSPTPTAKKRSFWDITTANSPSVTTVNGRKTKSHLTSTPAPSMLLQPGFAARQKA